MPQIKNGLKPTIYHFDTLSSTNDYARELLKGDKPLPTVILADHQTAGRGRRGRSYKRKQLDDDRLFPLFRRG